MSYFIIFTNRDRKVMRLVVIVGGVLLVNEGYDGNVTLCSCAYGCVCACACVRICTIIKVWMALQYVMSAMGLNPGQMYLCI